MKQVKFGIRFTVNEYARGELDHFVDCTDSIEDVNDLRGRYIDFVNQVMDKKVKPSTLVDTDVLKVFADDLYNRALIDYVERHFEDDERIMKGGEMFLRRYQKLCCVHGNDMKSSLDDWSY